MGNEACSSGFAFYTDKKKDTFNQNVHVLLYLLKWFQNAKIHTLHISVHFLLHNLANMICFRKEKIAWIFPLYLQSNIAEGLNNLGPGVLIKTMLQNAQRNDSIKGLCHFVSYQIQNEIDKVSVITFQSL